MTNRPSSPADVLAAALRSDPGRPRITVYDDTPGPTRGERIELSAKVLANWVAKAANALQEEWDLGPESVVRLALPPHWRAAYWALAAWSVGACVATDDGPADLVVGTDPEVLARAASPGVLVTLPALARSAPTVVDGDVMDEARDLSTFGDRLVAWEEPDDDDPALRTPAGTTAYADVVAELVAGAGLGELPERARVHTSDGDLERLLGTALAAWAVDGSLVLSRGEPEPAVLARRLDSEGVTTRR